MVWRVDRCVFVRPDAAAAEQTETVLAALNDQLGAPAETKHITAGYELAGIYLRYGAARYAFEPSFDALLAALRPVTVCKYSIECKRGDFTEPVKDACTEINARFGSDVVDTIDWNYWGDPGAESEAEKLLDRLKTACGEVDGKYGTHVEWEETRFSTDMEAGVIRAFRDYVDARNLRDSHVFACAMESYRDTSVISVFQRATWDGSKPVDPWNPPVLGWTYFNDTDNPDPADEGVA